MAPDEMEHRLRAGLRVELEHVHGSQPRWIPKENAMDDSESRQNRYRAWLVPGGIAVVAVVLLAVVALPRSNEVAAAPSPSPSSALNAHEVATDQGIVSFGLEGGAIVVRLEAGGTTTELGRTSTSANATSGFAMVCGPADGPDSHRYVFGNLGLGATINYLGPSADGQGAPDGTFLFALRPGTIGTTGTIQSKPGHPALMIQVELGSGPGKNLVGFPGTIFAQAIATGQRQASGCYVDG